MEDVKIIAECSFCGIEKEVIPMIDSNKKICADCLIDLQDRLEWHYVPTPTNNNNVKEKMSCLLLVPVVIGL
ncbi:MAG: hypothetical protein PHS33_09335 [Candidatus Omnitrophica bacterium]|nr:hypothetical protein [Candidatus Omnitrophota bacterium]